LLTVNLILRLLFLKYLKKINVFNMNIYVSSLSFSVTDAELKQLFNDYGEVTSAKVIIDKLTNRSKGFGFVEIADDSAGEKAIKELNGSQFAGRTINVTVARPREERSSGGGGDRRSFGGGGNKRW